MERAERAEHRLAAGVFVALAVLHLLPVWMPPYLPTTDGPSHVYNAWILRGLVTGEAPPAIAEHFEVNARPFPNWLGQLGLAALSAPFPPQVAEKLLATAALLLLYGGVWYLAATAGLAERWWTIAALPLGLNQLFQFGFYNFALSLALLPWILGAWWRHRAAPGAGFAVRINLLLLACWLAHPLSFAVAGLCIAVLWLASLRERTWRRSLAHVAVLLPQLALPLWFFRGRGGPQAHADWSLERTAEYLGRLEVLASFDRMQLWVGTALAACLVALLLRTLWALGRAGERRGADVFLLLASLATLLVLWGPAAWGGGYLVKERLTLYPWLLLIPALGTGWPIRAQRAGAGVLAALALANLAVILPRAVERGREVATFVDGAAAHVPPGSRVLVMRWERRYPADALAHAIGHAAVRRGLVDWDDYQAKETFFPVRFRSSVTLPDLGEMLRMPPNLRVKGNRDLIDAVYTWKMPADSRVRRALSRWYRPIAAAPGAEVWVRRGAHDADGEGEPPRPARRPRRRRAGGA